MTTERLPMITVFAGPNGSGKSSVTQLIPTSGVYINADDIQRTNNCEPLEAAMLAEKMRYEAVEKGKDMTFETVLSTDRNLKLLEYAKSRGYFIKCYYILTCNSKVNIARVAARVSSGGHDVPTDKIISRYDKCMTLLPELIDMCDIINIYDNTVSPLRIFSKKKGKYRIWSTDFWSAEQIGKLTGIKPDCSDYLGTAE